MTWTDDSARPAPNPSHESEPQRPNSTSTWIIEQIAAHHGVAPSDLDEPLYERIDPEALDSLFATGSDGKADGPLTVTFTFAGVEVRLRRTSDGGVRLRLGTDEEGEPT